VRRGAGSLAIAVGWALACAGEAPPPPECPEAPECPAATREVIVVPVFDDGAEEHWCCAWDEGGSRRYALVAGPAACRERYAARGGAWTEGPECIPCCCRTAVSDTDVSKGFSYERTTPVACAGVGECLRGDAAECAEPPPGAPDRGKRKGGGR
jgi:hypothetical protein